jgi:hypothetical protein
LGNGNRSPLFDQFASRRLTWWQELGVGYYPVEAGAAPYDPEYFARYQRQADSEIGRALMQFRIDFVARHWDGALIDVGIGSGAFVEQRNRTFEQGGWSCAATQGFDINPAAVAWLEQRGLFADPYRPRVSALSFWDVLEHIEDFRPLLANATRWVFTSLPIFRDAAHVLQSKHYRKDEHIWYFTRDGLVAVMREQGFILVEESDQETRIGREDISAFAFRRI